MLKSDLERLFRVEFFTINGSHNLIKNKVSFNKGSQDFTYQDASKKISGVLSSDGITIDVTPITSSDGDSATCSANNLQLKQSKK